MKTTSFAAVSILTAVTCHGLAGTAMDEPVPGITPPADASWEFRIEPYAWLTAIDGSTGVRGYVADVDASFSDIFDVLDMAAALQFEARRERWGIVGDVFYAKLGEDATLAGPDATRVDLEFKQVLAELDLCYRIAEQPEGWVDVYAGMRYNYIDLDLNADTSTRWREIARNGSRDKDWLDPVVGVRAQWDLNPHWFLAGRGDVGGFGVNSDFTCLLQATVGYNFTKCVSAELGYRYLHTDYKDGGFTYDIDQAGLYTGLSFRF